MGNYPFSKGDDPPGTDYVKLQADNDAANRSGSPAVVIFIFIFFALFAAFFLFAIFLLAFFANP